MPTWCMLVEWKKEPVHGLKTAVISRDRDAIIGAAREALASGIGPETAIAEGLMPGLLELEALFNHRKISMPAITAIECAARDAREILLSKTPEGHPLKRQVKVVFGIAEGDPHSIGKSISASMLASRGYRVYDLGEDVPAERFVAKAQEAHADFIAVGTLVTSSMRHQKEVIDILIEKGLRDSHKVIVCGRTEIIAPSFAEEIGSDACGVDIGDFVVKLQKLADSKDDEET